MRVAVAIGMLLGLLLLAVWRWPPGEPPAMMDSSPARGAADIVAKSVAPETNKMQPEPDAEAGAVEADASADCTTQPQWDVETLRRELDTAATELAFRGDAESLTVAAILRSNETGEQAMDLLRTAARLDAASELIPWRMAQLCHQRGDLECDGAWLDDLLSQRAGSNAAAWTSIAGRRVRAGDLERAIEAVRNAIAAPQLSTYQAEQLDAVNRQLGSATHWSYPQRVLLGSDNIGTAIPFGSDLMRHCSTTEDAVWLDACDQLGQRFIADARQIEAIAAGYSLRRGVAQMRADEARMDEFDEAAAAVRATSAMTMNMENLNLLLSDENVLRQFVSIMLENSEQAAFNWLNDRVGQLREAPGFDRCKLQTNPFLSFGG